jgi:RNase P subunit RPR2
MTETIKQRPRVRQPVCPHCKLPMRYQTSEVDKQHANLRHVMFVCTCGFASDQVVAEL